MLYPKEDKTNRILMFACRTCNFSEPAPSHCVWRNQLGNTVVETAGVTTDVGQDPTVRENDFLFHGDGFCLMCGNIILEDVGASEKSGWSSRVSTTTKLFDTLQVWDSDESPEEEQQTEVGKGHQSSPDDQYQDYEMEGEICTTN